MEAPLLASHLHIDEADILHHYQLDEFRSDEWVEIETEKLSNQATTAAADERDADPLGIKRSVFERRDFRKSRQSRKSVQLSEAEKEFAYRVTFKSFNPKIFLRDVHHDTPYNELCLGAEHLRKQLEKRSESMRDLVRQHFDHFVNAKNAIDEVHDAMDNNGLTPDVDYGVAGFQERARVALEYAEMLFGPILERRGRTEKLRAAQAIVEKHKFFFNLPSSLTEHAKQKKYDLAVRDYKKGKHLMRTLIGKTAKSETQDTSDEEIASIPEGQRRLFARIWAAAEQVVVGIREDLLKQLEEAWRPVEQQEKNIRYLLDLDSGEDPGWHYLNALHKWGLDLLKETFDKFSDRINEIQKERQAALPGSRRGLGSAILRAPLLRKALDVDENQYSEIFSKERDSTAWEAIISVITALCDVMSRCLPTFWRATKKYIDGKYSNAPNYDKKEVRKSIAMRLKRAAGHLKKADECQRMSAEIAMRFTQLLARVLSIPDATPTNTGVPPMPNLPSSPGHDRRRKSVDLPVYTPASHTAITGYYLIRGIERVVRCRRDLHKVGTGKDVPDDAATDVTRLIRDIERKIREKCVQLLCDAWVNDTKAFYLHEDWQPHPKHPEVTLQVRLIYRLHKRTILQLVSLLGVDTVKKVDWSKDIEMPVSVRALDMACNSFLRSIFAWLDCLNHLASDAKLPNDRRIASINSKRNLNVQVRDFRTLTSGANLYRFHKVKLPKLARMTERLLATSLNEEIDLLINFSSRLRDRMVDQYVSRKVQPVLQELQNGLLMDGYDWTSSQPLNDLRPFVRRFLMTMVLVHAEVHALAPVLERRTLTTMQDYISQAWLAAHNELDRVGLGGFVQSMFEMYFVQKTLSVYCSDSAEDHYRQSQATLERAFRRFTSPDQGFENSGLESVGDPADRKLLRPAMEKMQERLIACRRASAIEYACFRPPGSRLPNPKARHSLRRGGSGDKEDVTSPTSPGPAPVRPPRPQRESSGSRIHTLPPPRSSQRPSLANGASPPSQQRSQPAHKV